MGIVQPPFLLDFGKAYIDCEPDYDATIMSDWEENGHELFESDWERVKQLISSLSRSGIIYLDAKPGNIKLRQESD